MGGGSGNLKLKIRVLQNLVSSGRWPVNVRDGREG